MLNNTLRPSRERCNAEEVALHVILHRASILLEHLEDEHIAAHYGLPARRAFTVRHRQFTLMRETFLQDEDVLMFYDTAMTNVAGDPDHVAMQYLHVGDIRPPCWWWTFGNLRPREAGRGFDPQVIGRLRESSPASRFIGPRQASAEPDETVVATTLPAGLVEEFEHFVGLAQHRFFDVPCAIAMARSLPRLLKALIDTPDLDVHRVWMLGERAITSEEMLIVDRDFCLAGHRQTWRLHADQTDHDARSWTIRLLADCSAKVVHQYATAAPELLLEMSNTPPPRVDPVLPQTLDTRCNLLSRTTTLAAFLRHRRHALGLEIPQIADAAILPAPVISGWEAGTPAAPSQLIRCAPVLQLPETVLLAAAEGVRDRGYWPLPAIPAAKLDRTQ